MIVKNYRVSQESDYILADGVFEIKLYPNGKIDFWCGFGDYGGEIDREVLEAMFQLQDAKGE